MPEQLPTDSVWYVAYGSNLALDRFRCYLAGGRPANSHREYDGCRDPSDPARAMGVFVPGGLVFAEDSAVWGGGMAFYDSGAPGLVACRAYLISSAQFGDVTAQEMRRPPGGEFARGVAKLLGEVETARTLGPGLYETVRSLGRLEDLPMLTVTHGDVAGLQPTPPSVAYLSMIATGLREAHDWDADTIAAYLAPAPGVIGHWTPDDIADIARREL